MGVEMTKELIEKVEELIEKNDSKAVSELLDDMHPADIADILDELNFDNAVYVIRLLDSETTSDILEELDEDTRERVLESLSAKEIAKEIDELETDAAADIIAELPEERQSKVIEQLEDPEHAKDITELLQYEEDTAGGLMGKEYIAVNENWNILRCVKEMRKQAENFDEVYTVYVVDDDNVLKGRLSVKSLLTKPTTALVKDIYIPEIHYVKTSDTADEVAQIMQKYDLFVLPVVDEENHLVGNITLDDVVDHIKEEAEKDYQLAAGLTDDVEADDSIFDLIKGRLPWLILGLLGGFTSVTILTGFGSVMNNPQYRSLFFFTPLIAAMAGNVGVQSSAIVVQALASGGLKNSTLIQVIKEIRLGLINGIILALLIIGFGTIMGYNFKFSITIGISLISVMLVAAVIGTVIPIFLDKKGINPALATGPFITTSNDIFGVFIFFHIAKLLLGF